MKDINKNILAIGDIVLYKGRQFDIPNNVPAIIDSLDRKSANILFNVDGMPFTVYSSYASLSKVEDVSEDVSTSLNAVKDIYANMKNLVFSA